VRVVEVKYVQMKHRVIAMSVVVFGMTVIRVPQITVSQQVHVVITILVNVLMM